MNIFHKILKAGDGKRLKAISAVVAPVAALEDEISALSDSALQAKTGEFRSRIDQGADLDSLMFEAFAVTREAAKRVIGQRHYDVQMMGGAALHWGWVAEMKTGEGKTLSSTLPIYLNALAGKGVHAITVNEYLASRDAEWMGEIHRWLGLTVGLVVPSGSTDSAFKRAQYAADVTYGTNNEFGFDYLRDNMARSLEAMTQRGHSYAIVDEIDSILIDEARTPLIISGKVAGAADLYYKFADVAKRLVRDDHYEVDEEKRIVAIMDEGVTRVEELLDITNLYDGVQGDLVHQLNSALRAKELFKKDKDYLVSGDEVKIVDEFTGRVLDGRRWSDGLHQAVEAKEKVRIKEEQQTMATVTLQNYFRMYDKLSGMTGTALGDAAELENTYGLAVVQIPTNRPLVRLDQADYIYKTEMAKFDAVAEDLEERVANGQPVLVGTASVAKSELLSHLLDNRSVKHEVLNAKAHFREADIVAQAGQPGAVTVATNMAGRGVDIILGGNAEKLAERDLAAEGLEPDSEEAEAYLQKRLEHWTTICEEQGEHVKDSGGLYVLATERHESRRIDDQLRGRAGRQGEPGESRFYLSLEDDLMRIFASGAMSWVMDKAMPDDVPIESKAVTKSVERAQQTVEQRNAEIRKNVLKYDEVFNQQRQIVYARRMQLLEQGDLAEDTVAAVDQLSTDIVAAYTQDELDDTWDLDGLHTELNTFWNTDLTVSDFEQAGNLRELSEMISEDGHRHYRDKEEEVGSEMMRKVERQIMLQLTDQRWREHLTDMDSLRDGISLRAMGQKDPLTEWQREGFDLFSDMMAGINQDYVKYLMHVQVAPPEPAPAAPSITADSAAAKASSSPAPSTAQPKRVAQPVATELTAGRADTSAITGGAPAESQSAPAEAANKTVVKDEWDKTPRNAPCPCGSGKKFKQCHAR